VKTRNLIKLKLREHYFFEDHEIDDYTYGKKVKELDIDSISMLELFLIIETAFDLQGKVSDHIDMNEVSERTVDEFFDALAKAVDEIKLKESA
jgi:acyl carrier protein